MSRPSPAGFFLGITTAVITWFALIVQLILTTGSVTNYFSYFTILSNLLVAVCLTLSLLAPNSSGGRFFSTTATQTAIALYMLIVGLVYNLVLRSIWVVTGWQWVVDNLLHVVDPILFLLYWFLYSRKKKLPWKTLFAWLVFPGIYVIYSLIRGSLVHWYPYPFLNVGTLGYGTVLVNMALVMAAFILFGLLFLFITRKRSPVN